MYSKKISINLMSMNQVNQWHIAMIGPVLYYIGNKEEKTNKIAYIVLATLTTSILFVVRRPSKLDKRGIINLAHYAVFIPLFGYIVYKNNKLPSWSFSLIKYLGISVVAIHLYHLFKHGKHKH